MPAPVFTLVAILGLSTNNVLMQNDTGVKIVRIEIDGRKFEEVTGQVNRILVHVTPMKHDLIVTFKGGAQITWPHFDFNGVHEVIFYRFHNKIKAHPE